MYDRGTQKGDRKGNNEWTENLAATDLNIKNKHSSIWIWADILQLKISVWVLIFFFRNGENPAFQVCKQRRLYFNLKFWKENS